MVRIEEALREVKRGGVLIIVDDEHRENEGDFFVATEKFTPQIVNFMAQLGRGLICISLPINRLEKLRIPPMSPINTAPHGTAFHLSCEAKGKVTTGVSAFDRFETMKKLIDPKAGFGDFLFPGHVFPLAAKPLGVLERPGHTEAATDLASLAGLKPSGVIVEIMDDDGRMAKLPKLEKIAQKFGLQIVSIMDLISFRKRNNLLGSLYVEW